MECNTKPILNVEQIAICDQCRHISEKKRWCCKLGFWVREQPRIFTNQKEVVLADVTHHQPPSIPQMIGQFSKAMLRWAKSGLKTADQAEYVRRRTICSQCAGGWRCPVCGCAIVAKSALATERCPNNKW